MGKPKFTEKAEIAFETKFLGGGGQPAETFN
jgi:hypothetical protein